MGGHPPVDSSTSRPPPLAPASQPVAPEVPGPILLADGKAAPVKAGAAGDHYETPASPAREPRGTSPLSSEKVAADAREKARELLETEAKPGDDPSKAEKLANARKAAAKAADDDVVVQNKAWDQFSKAKAKNPELFEHSERFQQDERELKRNVADARLLKHLAEDDIPLQQIPRRLAQLGSMQARASASQTVDEYSRLPGPNTGDESPEEKVVIDRQREHMQNTLTQTAHDHRIAVNLWKNAGKAAPEGSDEARRCAEGLVEALRMQEKATKLKNEIDEYLKISANPLAADAAKEAYIQFHKAVERLLHDAELRRIDRANESAVETENDRIHKANTKADDENRGWNRQEEVGKKKQISQKLEQARADLRDSRDRLDTIAENKGRARQQAGVPGDFDKSA
jgi:hypothetical protein